MTSYTALARQAKSRVRQAVKRGMPDWAKRYALEKMHRAHFYWARSRDKSVTEGRRDRIESMYQTATREALEVSLFAEFFLRRDIPSPVFAPPGWDI